MDIYEAIGRRRDVRREFSGEGRELLLAITLEPEKGDVSHEIMLGVPLQVGEFRA